MGNNIHKSAQNGDLKAVRRCLDKQIDVNKRGAEETTPLHKAAEHGHVAVCELLLSRGADVKAKDEDGNMPLHCAATKGHSPVCELLVSRGAEVKAKNTDGRTPLHSAAYNGHLKVCEMLLLRGADVKARDKYGDTPLDDAKAQQMLEVSVLLERWTLKAAAIAVVPSESFGPKSMQAPPLEGPFRFHAFFTHDWGLDELGRNNHMRILSLAKQFSTHGLQIAVEEVEGRAKRQNHKIDESAVVVVFITKRFMEKVANGVQDNCLFEFDYASKKKGLDKMLFVLNEKRLKDEQVWCGPVGNVLKTKSALMLWEDTPETVDVLLREIISHFRSDSAV